MTAIQYKTGNVSTKTSIRAFRPKDIEMLWRECRRGRLAISKNTGYGGFLEYFTFILKKSRTHWIVEDNGMPIGIMLVNGDGWTIEPHVEFFNDISNAAIYRGYICFFDEIENMTGVCVIKALGIAKNLFDKLCSKGYLQYVGLIPDGDPEGDIYMYCTKQKRRDL